MEDAEAKKQLLSQFQRKTLERKEAIEGGADVPEAYEAFKPVDQRQIHLHVRPVSGPGLWIRYGSWLHIVDEPSGRRLDVYFASVVVTITGRHLGEVAYSIASERCAFIQAFNPKRWAEPKDKSAVFIDKIDYLLSQPPE